VKKYTSFINRYYKLVLIVLLLITILMGWFATKIQTNATPYFLDIDHPSRIADKKLKEVFKGSGEVLIVTTQTNEGNIFNKRSLTDLYSFTQEVEALTLTNESDLKHLNEITRQIKIDDSLKEHFKLLDALKPSDYTNIKVIQSILKSSPTAILEDKEFIDSLLIRVWPIKKVRGLVNIESISASDKDSFDIHALMPYVPKNDTDIKHLENEAYGNKLLKDILFTEKNKSITNTLIELRIPQEDAPNMKRIYDIISDIPAKIGTKDTYYISGPPAIFAQTAAVVKENSDKMFPFVIMIVLVMLYLLYKNKYTVIFPVTVSIISVVWVIGTMAFLGYEQNIVGTMLPVFLISIGVSDSIHFLSEYHKCEKGNASEKVEVSLEKVFKPMLYTSLTTMIGFLALTYTPISFIKEFGVFVAVGIFYAFIITVTLIPALQLIFDTKTNTVSNPTMLIRFGKVLEDKIVFELKTKSTFIWIGIALVVISSIIGIERLKIDNEMIEYFSSKSKVYKDTKFINTHFGGSSTVEFTLSSSKDGYFKSKEAIINLDQAIKSIGDITNVGTVYALPNFIKLMNKGLHSDKQEYFSLPKEAQAYPQYLFLYENSNGKEIFNVVNKDYTKTRLVIFSKSDRTSSMDHIVTQATKYLSQHLPDVKITPSGFGEVLISTRDEVIYGQISSLMISFSMIFVFLLFLFKSIKIALIGLVPLLITLIINFGIMGWLGLYLDVGSAIVAAIAIGIGVDNAIYYISYYRSSTAEDRNIEAAKKVFSALYANSLVLGSGFLVLIMASHEALVNLGWLVSSTVIVSTTVTLLVLPQLLNKFHTNIVKDK